MQTLIKTLSKTKEPKAHKNQTNVVYQTDWTNRKLEIQIHEHQLATKTHDSPSLISAHDDREYHKFSLENSRILAQEGVSRSLASLERTVTQKRRPGSRMILDTIEEPINTCQWKRVLTHPTIYKR